MATPERLEAVAHVFRRCSFGPVPGQVEAWVDEGPDDLIDDLLARTEINDFDPQRIDAAEDDNDAREDAVRHFFDLMMSPTNPLHERMTWYWHTHFTTSGDKSNAAYALRQHRLLRRHALGNFRDLARDLTTDAAMLYYLDGAASVGDNPNENYAREFLELFTLGRDGGWGEDDVRAGARILAGWTVDWETAEVTLEPDRTYDRPVTFMGERRRWTLDDFIDFICELPQCAEHVARRLSHHLVGPDPSDDRIGQLAKVFRDHDLEIRPLVAELLHGDDFAGSIRSRTRQPLEWTLAALPALGYDSIGAAELEPWVFEAMGQMPYRPPNVGGWPLDDRWSSPSQLVSRTALLLDWELSDDVVDAVDPTVDAVLARCGIYTPSASTRAALDDIETNFSEYDRRLELLFATTLISPEFSLL